MVESRSVVGIFFCNVLSALTNDKSRLTASNSVLVCIEELDCEQLSQINLQKVCVSYFKVSLCITTNELVLNSTLYTCITFLTGHLGWWTTSGRDSIKADDSGPRKK